MQSRRDEEVKRVARLWHLPDASEAGAKKRLPLK